MCLNCLDTMSGNGVDCASQGYQVVHWLMICFRVSVRLN